MNVSWWYFFILLIHYSKILLLYLYLSVFRSIRFVVATHEQKYSASKSESDLSWSVLGFASDLPREVSFYYK